MKFVLNRNYTHSSTLGHTIEFKRGEPTHVPDALHSEVLRLGAEPVDGDVDALELEAAVKSRGPQGSDRLALITAAIEDIVKANQREDFTSGGEPTTAAITTKVGFTVGAEERNDAWAQYRKAAGL